MTEPTEAEKLVTAMVDGMREANRSLHITSEIAHQTLYFFGHGGHTPGSFAKSLFRAICVADPQNRERLGYGFPGYVNAVRLIQDHEDGIARLREIATKG